jgi:hypothetical protein
MDAMQLPGTTTFRSMDFAVQQAQRPFRAPFGRLRASQGDEPGPLSFSGDRHSRDNS